MYRYQVENLAEWIGGKNRKPLVIRGARQVGKSTLVELFARQAGLPLRTVNLERHPELAPVLSGKNPQEIIQELEFLPGMGTINRETLLFFDEIQAVPEALPALRYFYEDMPDLPVICAGSLLEFALADHTFSMPVGRIRYLHMGPMTFTEFLLALGEKRLREIIVRHEPGREISSLAHERLLKLLRTYFFVGGMPEAVATFADTRSFREVGAVHRSIIDTYRDDFPKYAGSRKLTRLLTVFNFAARNVGRKVKYANISSQDQSATLKRDIQLLAMARVINKVVHSHCSGLPLQAGQKETVYKLLFLDIGLMNTICGLDRRSLGNIDDRRLVNEGALAEQFIGRHLQELLADQANRELNYWLREGRSANAELDFVLALAGEIIPVEVKSGTTGTLKSLHQFMGEKDSPLAVRFDLGQPSRQQVETVITRKNKRVTVRYPLLSLPLYLVERLEDIVRQSLAGNG